MVRPAGRKDVLSVGKRRTLTIQSKFHVLASFLETVVSFPFPIPRLVVPNSKRHNAHSVSHGASGLQSLEEACVFTKPEGEGFDRQLWEGWTEGGEELVTALQGEDGSSMPSNAPALLTPSPSTPAASQPEGGSQPAYHRQCSQCPVLPLQVLEAGSPEQQRTHPPELPGQWASDHYTQEESPRSTNLQLPGHLNVFTISLCSL